MASESWPNASHNDGAVTTTEYEQMAALGFGTGLVGTTDMTGIVYADATGRQVKIRAGRYAVVRGAAWYSGASDITVAISANASGSTRIDRLVLRLTRATGVITETVVEGTPGSGAPALETSTGTTGLYDFPLAKITVADGTTSLDENTVDLDGWYLAPQPIASTAATWPPFDVHFPGWIMLDVAAARAAISTGSEWLDLYRDSGWVTASAAGGWAFDGRTRYRRRDGLVTLNVAARRAGSSLPEGTNSTILTLPAGYRPAFDSMTLVGYVDGSRVARAKVDASGQVILDNYNYVFTQGWFLSGTVSFPAD